MKSKVRKVRYLRSLFICAMMVLLVFGLLAQGAAQPMVASSGPIQPTGASLEVTGGERVLENSVALSSLTIAEGASLAAPEGKALTMTVNGIGKGIEPGVYKGDIFITVTDKFFAPPSGLQLMLGRHQEPQEFRTAVLIEDGKYIPEKSVQAIVQGGKVTDKAATNVTIMGCEDDFNGIVITGDSEYTIEGLKIDFEGNGSNDFIGIGAGIAIFDDSKVTINNSEIKLHGLTRAAIHFGGNSVTTLNNCRLINESPDSEEVVPLWALGLRGTNRGTQHCDRSTIYYNNCLIQGNGWGALCIDGGEVIRIYVKDSTVNLTGPRARGYGAFSIGDALISYDNCIVNVQGFPILMGGSGDTNDKNNGEITNGSIVNGSPYGVMIFRDSGSELKVNKGATINSTSSTFVVKGSNSYLNIDNAVLNPGNGVILQLMDSDEPGMGPSRFIVPIGADVPIPGRDLTVADPKEDVFMTVSNMEVNGNFYNSTTNLRANCIEPITAIGGGYVEKDQQGVKNLDLKFEGAKVNGVISAATAAYKEGVVIIDVSNCEELSAVTQTADEPVNNGVIVSFDKKSVWTVAGTSYLTSLTIAQGAAIKAPSGKTLTMTVDGVKTEIAAGTYTGKIVLTVG